MAGKLHAPAILLHSIGVCVGPRDAVDGAENPAPFGIRFPDRPGRSQSLYRLRYHSPQCDIVWSRNSSRLMDMKTGDGPIYYEKRTNNNSSLTYTHKVVIC